MNLNSLLRVVNEWQWKDRQGDVYPWFCRPFLDYLETLDLSKKRVLEWGSGHGTLWFAKKCHHVVTIDNSEVWVRDVREEVARRGWNNRVTSILEKLPVELSLAECTVVETQEPYVHNVPAGQFDLIVVDGMLRNACIKKAREKVSPGGMIILDNASWGCYAAAHEMMRGYKCITHRQSNHPDWTTDCWYEKMV